MNLSNDQKLIATLQGEVIALQTIIGALLASHAPQHLQAFEFALAKQTEHTKSNLLGLAVPEETIQGFDQMLQKSQPKLD